MRKLVGQLHLQVRVQRKWMLKEGLEKGVGVTELLKLSPCDSYDSLQISHACSKISIVG